MKLFVWKVAFFLFRYSAFSLLVDSNIQIVSVTDFDIWEGMTPSFPICFLLVMWGYMVNGRKWVPGWTQLFRLLFVDCSWQLSSVLFCIDFWMQRNIWERMHPDYIVNGRKWVPGWTQLFRLLFVDCSWQLSSGGYEIFEKECIPFFQLFGTNLRLLILYSA